MNIINKDIDTIINKYLDYSIKTLFKIYEKKQYIFRLKPDVSIMDIITRACYYGYSGVYFNVNFIDAPKIKQMIIDEKLQDKIKLRMNCNNYELYLKIKDVHKYGLIHISYTNTTEPKLS